MAEGSYLKGFGVTFKKLFEDRVTGDYRGGKGLEKGKPDEKRPKADRLHGRHVLNRYEDGMEKCIGCELCAGVCPAKCIYVRGADNNPEAPTSPGEQWDSSSRLNGAREYFTDTILGKIAQCGCVWMPDPRLARDRSASLGPIPSLIRS